MALNNQTQTDLAHLQNKLGHQFSNLDVLTDALTHTSVEDYNSSLMGYERLEFLGDRVLGLVVAELLLNNFPNEDEGAIAKRHTALVQRKALVTVARQIDLGAYLILSEGERKSGGHDKDAILSDATEAVIAALYLDGGLPVAVAFIEKYWRDLMTVYTAPPEDPKTQLQEWTQARHLPLPKYRVISEEGAAHEPVFVMAVEVKGHDPVTAKDGSKKRAEKKAATRLLKQLNKEQTK